MIREEAIEVLQKNYPDSCYSMLREAVDMAIEALQAKPDGDLISRQALCEYALNQKDKAVTPNDIMRFPSAEAVPQSEQYKKGFEDAKRAFLIEYARESENMRKRNAELEVMLNAQKAISAEAEWIPCSERLPEDGQGVIICTDDKRFKDHPVGTCIYEDGSFHTNFYDDISIIAWKPLPKPYCPNCGAKMGGEEE